MSKTYKVWTPAEEEFLKREYGEVPTEEIAKKLKRTKRSVYSKARLLGLSEEFESYEELSEQQEKQLLELFDRDISTATIAKITGIDRMRVGNKRQYLIRKGILVERDYKHLSPDDYPLGRGRFNSNMVYAYVDGDYTIVEGNIDELADALGFSRRSIEEALRPTQLKRRTNKGPHFVFLYDENEFDD